MQPLVSVIIPLYNGENYIEKCLDSILAQNYTPLEIVIVDDDSKDGGVDIIKEYEQKHVMQDVSIAVIRQSNQGQGAARNTGIRHAKGRYLMFMDQDDTINPGLLLSMVSKAIAEDCDIVSAGYRRVTLEGKTKQLVRLKNAVWSKYRVIAPWSKLYSAQFIKDNEIVFLPVVLGEDIYFLMQAYSYEPKVAFLGDIGYNWLDNAHSVSNTAHKELAKDTSLLRLFDMLENLERIEVLKRDRMYEYFLLKTAVWDILYTARSNTYESVQNNVRFIWKWFDNHFPGYYKNPNIRLHKPEGEGFLVRFIVWGYMTMKRLHLEKLFLKLLSK